MRIYAASDEERIHIQGQVRDWIGAGLLEKAQGEALDAMLRTDLRRTNVMLRAVLAFFTTIITAAAIGLVFVTLNVRGESGAAALVGLAAVGCFLLAEAAVSRLRFYRFGIEEAWASGAVLLTALCVGLSASTAHLPKPEIAALVAGAAAALWVYHRFGLVYALVAALICAAVIPFQVNTSGQFQRLTSAVMLLLCFGAARAFARRHRGTYRESDFDIAQAAALIGAYIVINVQLSDPLLIGLRTTTERGWFYWFTYVVVWAMPAVALFVGIRERNRMLLDAAIVLALLTLATNKSYLGLTHQSWDPMLLGVLLGGVALGVRRWLASGENGERNGFTPARIIDADRELLQTVANVSTGFQQHAAPPPQQPQAPGFGGGRSGGGGASAGY